MESSVRPVKIVELVNPFQPDVRRQELLLAPRPQENLADCLTRAGMKAQDYVLVLNGARVADGEEAFHTVMPGAEILCSSAAGGGAWKMVAMIGVMALAAAVSGGLGDVVEAAIWNGIGFTGMVSTATTALAAAAISIGGNMLISATMNGSGGSVNSASVTYDPSGPKTLAQPGTPVPKGYGTMGWGGNICSSFVDQDGSDEYLNVLVNFGFGLATNMATMLLNGKPIGAYPDLAYAQRLGTNTQNPIAGFDRIENVYSQEIELLAANGPTTVTGTGLTTTGLQIAVKFPGGLMRTDSSGNPKECSLAYQVRISPSGQNAWTTPIFPKSTSDVYTIDANGYRHYPYWVVMPTDRYAGSGIVYSTDTNESAHYAGEPWTNTEEVTVYDVDNNSSTYNATFTGEWQMTVDITLDLQSVTSWWSGWRIVSNMTDQSFYDVVNIFGLTSGRWDVEVTKWGAGPHNQPIPQGDSYMTDPHYTADAWLWNVAEIQFADLSYPNQILLGIRALATSQISGADLTVTATITHVLGADTVVPAALAGFETDNPALVAFDIIMNPLYGMAATNSLLNVDVPAFERWAQFNDETVTNSDGTTSRRHVFAGVFDTGGSNAWACLQKVAMMSRAEIVQIGNLYTVWIDAPTDVTQVFTEANMARGSYSETFLDMDSRATCIEVTFSDAARSFRTDLPVSIISEATANSGLQPKITRTNLLGCTSRDQAWRWAYFQLASTSTLLRTATWNCGIEAVSCQKGSVVGVQQRQWAVGGRVQSGSTTTALQIDRTDLQPYSPTGGWTVGVTHPVLLRGTAVLASVVSAGELTIFTFTGTLPAGRLMRVLSAQGGEGAITGYSGNTVTAVASGNGFAAGLTVSLYDYDVVDIIPVSAVNGTTITPATPFMQAPTPDAPWFYAASGGDAPYKTFRVTDVRRSGDFQVQISAIDYNPAIYEDVIPVYGEVFAAPTVDATVSGLGLVEKLQNTTSGSSKSGTQAQITASWSLGANCAGADVWGSVDGGALNHMAHLPNGTSYQFMATTGDVWEITVVGFDRLGVSASMADAPTATITVEGIGAAPPDVTGFSGSYEPNTSGGQTVLTWGASTKVGIVSPGRPVVGTNVSTVESNYTYEIRFSAASSPSWNNAILIATGLPGGQVLTSVQTGAVTVLPGTYTDTVARLGTYMIKALSSAYVESIDAAMWASSGSSSPLNAQGSVVPSQAIVASYTLSQPTSGSWELLVSCSAQTLILSDGTTVNIPATSLTWTGLSSSTTYYVYTYIGVADLAIHCASGDPPTAPPTSSSALYAAQAASDGRYQGPAYVLTTGATGTAGTGGSTGNPTPSSCPESLELVWVAGRGHVPAGTVRVGDDLLGWDFVAGRGEWKKVAGVTREAASTWHVVAGRRVSPCHPLMLPETARTGAHWQPAFELGEYERFEGQRVKIQLEEQEYDQQNFWVYDASGKVALLMHNSSIAPVLPD